MLQMIINILIVISGICWSAVYIDSIRIGFKQKTYCMPLFALGLNIAWEGIYSYTDLFIRHSYGAQAFANAAWFLLDIFILTTWFKFAKDEMQGDVEKKYFVPWTILVLIACFVLQILFMVEFGDVEGEKYSAFLQNIAMSITYLYMLNSRRSSKGQSMTIAICKCIGTLTPTIFGTIEGNTFILVTGIICFIFDIIYIFFLHKVIQKEKLAETQTA
ncbi:MAG: hypothetical protein J6B26_06695 [Agathobacter sp.]|nr:hypothetical protein [Agathobacter sp.]